VAQLYPQALGSLFVASYDSQGYGGGIRSRLHTGANSLTGLCFDSPDISSARAQQKTPLLTIPLLSRDVITEADVKCRDVFLLRVAAAVMT
jgi:hypothetical protein